MARQKRIRRRLTLSVSERPPANPAETWTPGARFATGWQKASIIATIEDCHGDPIQIAGFLAHNAAYAAHHYATNYMENEAAARPVQP